MFYVEEPNVSLVQSGFQLCYGATANIPGLNIRAGSQAYRAYTEAATVLAGMVCVTQRIDSGSVQGAGITFGRGKNTLTVDMYGTSATVYASNIGGVAYINYLSDVASAGIGAHNHTMYEILSEYTSAAQTIRRVNGKSFQIPESQYYIVAIGTWMFAMQTASGGLNIIVNLGSGQGWEWVYTDILQTDSELGECYSFAQAGSLFRRYPESSEGVNPETSRDYMANFTSASRFGFCMLVTYHSITRTVAGTISGFTGDGSGITVQLIEEDTGDVLNSTTTAVGGTFSMTWYDDVHNVYCTAKQSTDRAGRSLSGAAV
jgi:hypothetical protein